MPKRQRILIDTDIGDDVDDALALAFAARSPELEIAGVTTVFKNVSQRARLAKAVLSAFGRGDVPVCEGIGTPIINHVDVEEIPCQCGAAGDGGYQKDPRHAVDFLLDTVRGDPSLIIVAIGPLTNLAVAALKEPQTIARTRICLMGGAFGTTEPEWNILCDPEAASVVFRSGAEITAVGLDVTTQCALPSEKMRVIERAAGEGECLLNRLCQAWRRHSGFGVTLHDPLVIGQLIDPSILTFEPGEIVVELSGSHTRGATLLKRSFFPKPEHPNARIATKVDSGKFIGLFMDRVFDTQKEEETP